MPGNSIKKWVAKLYLPRSLMLPAIQYKMMENKHKESRHKQMERDWISERKKKSH